MQTGGVKINLAFYHGKRYGAEKEAYFSQADVFVFPTYYHNECFPLVLLEAMQQGIACIASNEGGIADIIDEGKTGFIVDKKNTTALAEKMEVLLNNPSLCHEMGKNGKQKFCEAFTIERFENRMKNLLEKLLAE